MTIKVGDWVKYHVPFGRSGLGEVEHVDGENIRLNVTGIHPGIRQQVFLKEVLKVRPAPKEAAHD